MYFKFIYVCSIQLLEAEGGRTTAKPQRRGNVRTIGCKETSAIGVMLSWHLTSELFVTSRAVSCRDTVA